MEKTYNIPAEDAKKLVILRFFFRRWRPFHFTNVAFSLENIKIQHKCGFIAKEKSRYLKK